MIHLGGNMMSDKIEKRKDCLTWDEYFMSLAKITAGRSKDPNTQVGACIVSKFILWI